MLINNPKSFYLSDEENEKVFEKKVLVKANRHYDFTPQSNPKVFLSGGLPGAGKTNLIDKEKKMMEKDNHSKLFIANSDEMRPYHPRYAEALKLFGTEAGSAVHHDATIFSDKLIDYALNEKADFIIDSTLKNPKKTEEILSKLQNANYRIKVSMLTVNEYESMQGILNRYAEQYRDNPTTARFVDQRFIKIGKEDMLLSAEVIDKKCIHEFKLLDREHNILYDSTKDFNRSAKEVMYESTQLKNFSSERREKLIQSWEQLIEKLKEYSVPLHIQDKAETIHNELKVELLHAKDDSDFWEDFSKEVADLNKELISDSMENREEIEIDKEYEDNVRRNH